MLGLLLSQLTLPTSEQLTNYQQSTAVHNYSLHIGRTVIISVNAAHLWVINGVVLNSCTKLLSSQR